MDQDFPDITGLLVAWRGGDAGALERLMDLVYPEMRRIARRHLQDRRPGQSLESADLANEAYLKLVRAGRIECENRIHFLALCSQIIRRILVDHARRRGSAKRGADALQVPLDDIPSPAESLRIDMLALDKALDSLAGLDPRKSRVVELRYIVGLSIEEAAEVLGVSADTAKRDWRIARAWLIAELTRKREPDQR